MGVLKRLQDGLTAPPEMDVAGPGKWSARSQKDSLEIVQCRTHIGRIDIWIDILRKDIDRLESHKPQHVSQVGAGNGSADLALRNVIEQLRNQRERLQIYEDSKASLQAKIKALEEPSEDKKHERADHQRKLARLAEQRAKLDDQAAAQVESLRKLLNERAELTRSMQQEGEAIGLTCEHDYFDEARFQELQKHLPADLAQLSQGWLDWFFGKRQDEVVCEIKGEVVSIRENLASPGVYLKGERVRLPKNDAHALHGLVAPATP